MTAILDSADPVPSVSSVTRATKGLMLMSRGVYILMGSICFTTLGILKLGHMLTPYATDRLLPLVCSIFLLATVGLQWWRRTLGLGVMAAGDLNAPAGATPGALRPLEKLVLWMIGGIAIGVSAVFVPQAAFQYLVLAWMAGLTILMTWRLKDAGLWEKWVLVLSPLSMGLLVGILGIESGVGVGFLALGIFGIIGGGALQWRWNQWVGQTNANVAADANGGSK